jgi:threonine/homoserine/homoserine lactone efflux protein
MNYNFIGYLIFASVACFTPGPNNLMLLSYGKAYGFDDSSKVMAGIASGIYVILYLAGYGIAELITNNAALALVLRIIGSLWMLYLAVVLSKISAVIVPSENKKIGFSQAFFQQFVNIKALMMAVIGAGAFMPNFGNIHLNVFIYATSFALIGIPAMFVWLKMGDMIARIFRSERSNRILGYTMFLLMILTIVAIWVK